jgi:two-component system sensor histidine kinase AlgZ
MTDIDADVMRKATIPALLLQPLLENAVHYGVEPSQQPASIHVRIGRALDKIEIVVVNPYHADSISMGNHMALGNIRERLTLLYDVEAQLTTIVENGFFEVRLRLPYKKAD